MLLAPSSTRFGEGRSGFGRNDVRCRAEVGGGIPGASADISHGRDHGRIGLVRIGGSECRGQPGVEDSRCAGQGGGDDASVIALFCSTRQYEQSVGRGRAGGCAVFGKPGTGSRAYLVVARVSCFGGDTTRRER